jgi:hypothetical protein
MSTPATQLPTLPAHLISRPGRQYVGIDTGMQRPKVTP